MKAYIFAVYIGFLYCIGYSQRKDYHIGSLYNWTQSRNECSLADYRSLCNSSIGYCDIKIDDAELNLFSSVWIDGYIVRSPWIVNEGCSFRINFNFANNSNVIEVGASNSIAKCVMTCGYSEGYALHGNYCYCMPFVWSIRNNTSYCDTPCAENPSERCGGLLDLTYINISFNYFTYYKTVHDKTLTKSPWKACGAIYPGKYYNNDEFDVEDCRTRLPYLCSNYKDNFTKGDMYLNETLSTWDEARISCQSMGFILIDRVPENWTSIEVKIDMPHWIGIFAINKWIWNEDLTENESVECFVLHKETAGTVELETRDCGIDNISGLCVNEIKETNSKDVTTGDTPREITEKGQEESLQQQAMRMKVYIYVGIGTTILVVLVITAFALKRRWSTRKKRSKEKQSSNVVRSNIYSLATCPESITEDDKNDDRYVDQMEMKQLLNNGSLKETKNNEDAEYNQLIRGSIPEGPGETNMYDNTNDFNTPYHALDFKEHNTGIVGIPELYDHTTTIQSSEGKNDETYDCVDNTTR